MYCGLSMRYSTNHVTPHYTFYNCFQIILTTCIPFLDFFETAFQRIYYFKSRYSYGTHYLLKSCRGQISTGSILLKSCSEHQHRPSYAHWG